MRLKKKKRSCWNVENKRETGCKLLVQEGHNLSSDTVGENSDFRCLCLCILSFVLAGNTKARQIQNRRVEFCTLKRLNNQLQVNFKHCGSQEAFRSLDSPKATPFLFKLL